jgi:hypothetical protein
MVYFADIGTAFGLDASMDSVPAAEPAAMKKGSPSRRAPTSGCCAPVGANSAEQKGLYFGSTTLSIT